MAASWSGLQTALEAAIVATWPQVRPAAGGGGIWEADRIERIDFDKITASGGVVKAPYAVTEYGEATPAEGAPITAKIYAVPVTLHYIARVDATGAGASLVRPQLEAMEDYLLATGLGNNYPVLSVSAFALPPMHSANEVFIAVNLPWAAGSVTALVWVGES